jgi:hypothetical protein
MVFGIGDTEQQLEAVKQANTLTNCGAFIKQLIQAGNTSLIAKTDRQTKRG